MVRNEKKIHYKFGFKFSNKKGPLVFLMTADGFQIRFSWNIVKKIMAVFQLYFSH